MDSTPSFPLISDYFAVDLLRKGVSLENVAALLGNSVRIAEKHYAPWVQTRQESLEREVKKTWAQGNVITEGPALYVGV